MGSAAPACTLLLEIQACNIASKARTGDIDPAKAADIITTALAKPDKDRLILELGEYLAIAVDGTAMDPETWDPLEHFPNLTASF